MVARGLGMRLPVWVLAHEETYQYLNKGVLLTYGLYGSSLSASFAHVCKALQEATEVGTGVVPVAAHDTHLQTTCVGSRAESIVNPGPVAVCVCVRVCVCVCVCVCACMNVNVVCV